MAGETLFQKMYVLLSYWKEDIPVENGLIDDAHAHVQAEEEAK